MDTQIPLGAREDERLEFKAAEALNHPFTISREAVALLNAKGGEIWIGVREANEIAVEPEDISNGGRAKNRLLDHLVEAIEPRLGSEELQIEIVPHSDGHVLRVELTSVPKNRPYAQLKNGGRYFYTRVGSRIRPMSREEILAEATKGSGARDPDAESARKRLADLRVDQIERGRPGLWLALAPEPLMQIEVQDPELERLLVDPQRTGNRPTGWNFRYPALAGVKPRLEAEGLRYGEEGHRCTRIHSSGVVEFFCPIQDLGKGSFLSQEIYPLALLEYSVSIARLTAGVLLEHEHASTSRLRGVHADVALLEALGWRLPPYPPQTYEYDLRSEELQALDAGSFYLGSPLRFDWERFKEAPDHVGYLLVRAIYQAFHLREDRIPMQYDRDQRKLILK